MHIRSKPPYRLIALIENELYTNEHSSNLMNNIFYDQNYLFEIQTLWFGHILVTSFS